MAEFERYLQPAEVIQFFVSHQEQRVNHHDLIKHFRPLLAKDNDYGAENHDVLKKITSQLVIVKKMQGNKYFEIHPRFQGQAPLEILKSIELPTADAQASLSEVEQEAELQHLAGSDARSRDSVYEPLHTEEDCFVTPIPEQQQPRLRKLTSTRRKSKKLTTIQESKQEVIANDDDNENDDEENDDVFVEKKTLKRVQESVRDFETLTSKLHKEATSRDQIILRTRAHRSADMKKVRTSSTNSMHQLDPSYAPLTEKTRAWIIAGARNDEEKLRALLNQDPKICGTRDPATGYTALHWAAKTGNESMIHLLIGRYKLNPNVKTRGGYTPLILSAMFGRDSAFNLLMNTYGADPEIRDFSGKNANHYLSPLKIDSNYENEEEVDD